MSAGVIEAASSEAAMQGSRPSSTSPIEAATGTGSVAIKRTEWTEAEMVWSRLADMRWAILAAVITVQLGCCAPTQAALVSVARPVLVPIAAMPITRFADALGVPGADISKAGETVASRLTYLSGLIQETQWNVFARCSQILQMRQEDAPADAVAFCKDILRVPQPSLSKP